MDNILSKNPAKRSNIEKIRHRGNKDLIGAGDRNRVNSVTLFSFFIVDCGPNATGFLRDAYEGTSPRARGRLNEAGGKVRAQDGVCLL